MLTNMFGPGCRCCGAHRGPPYCPLTIRLLDCGGGPIEGAAVSIFYCPIRSAVPPIDGATDADGKYTFPTSTGIRDCYTIAWLGHTYGPFFGVGLTLWNCTHTQDFCYRHARIAVSTTAAAAPTVTAGALIFEATGEGTGEVVLEYRWLGYCDAPTPLPATVYVQSEPADGSTYLDNCTTLPLACGDDVAVSLPLFDWGADYAMYHLGCDQGCAARGEGPLYRGLAPRALFVTITPANAYSTPWAGNLAGVAIPVTWNGTYWDSGCLPDPGIPCTVAPYGAHYRSARLTIRWTPGGIGSPFPPGIGGFLYSFAAYGNADCTSPASGDCAAPLFMGGNFIGTVCDHSLYSPVDASQQVGGPFLSSFHFHFTE